MGSSERTTAADALANTWAAELVAHPRIVPARETLRPPEETLDETALPAIGLDGPQPDFELRGRLGAGGMAVVDLAWQRALDREVAIKQARSGRPEARATMVREARVAGGLEHPNIVPIHALGHDEDGAAVIVMKRVSGESWHALLKEPEHALWGEGDRLLRNLEILGQVCRAVELAHSRGWLHRDLKSENVMIGEFGEVYVLDWGIAVPLAIAERGEATFAGTPAHMAPEMAVAGVLTPQTDVFLLGAILHEVLTGAAINRAGSLGAILDTALTERAHRYPAEVPAELAAITSRATAYHAADRYPDVASFRRAIASFVVHRGSIEIAERAVERLDATQADGGEDPRDALIDALSGFRQALALWDANAPAAAGLDRCLRALVERELAHDSPTGASGWAAQLASPDAALEARIEERRAELERQAAELEELRDFAADRRIDGWVEQRRRRALAFAVVVVVVGFGGGAALRAGWFELGYAELTGLQLVTGAAAIVASIVRFRRQNLLSRWIGAVMIFAALSPFPVLAASWRLGLPAEAALALDAIVKAGGALVLGVIVQSFFRWVAVVYLVTAGLLLAFPQTYPLELASGGLAVALFLAAARMRTDVEPGPASRS